MRKQQEVTITSQYRLSGTLTIPNIAKDVYPAVLIIAGSGKSNRDGNLKKLKMNLYNDLAEFLTELGFITLRYDKRGTYKSEGNFLETGLSDLIEVAAACVKFLQNHPQVDIENMIILGHSEGALIAPAVHDKTPASSLILLAGEAKPNAELLPKQNEIAYKEMIATKGFKGWIFRTFKVVEKANKQNEKFFKKIAESEKDVIRVQGIKVNAKYFRETMNYNVVDYLTKVTCPVLAISGEKDIQISPSHAKRTAELVQGVTEWQIIPNMNHIFRKYDGNHTMLGLMKEYKSQLHQPIDKDLLDTLEAWLKKYY